MSSFRLNLSQIIGALLCAGMLISGGPRMTATAALAKQSAQTQSATHPAGAGHARTRKDAAVFRSRVDAILGKATAQKAFWGVLVADAASGEVLYELNPDRFFAPASNAKIFTSAFALAELGPDYRIHTTLESAGTLGADGRLSGDLILVGRGDADISSRVFPYAGKVEHEGTAEKILEELAGAAIAKGLKEVDGDLVADDSYFPYDPYPAGWSVGDLFFAFGGPISALTLNDNTVTVFADPGVNAGDPAVIRVEPAAAREDLTIDLLTSAAGGEPIVGVGRQPGPKFIALRGTIPAGHAPMRFDLAMIDPPETSVRALAEILDSRGVQVTGATRVKHSPSPEMCDSLEDHAVRASCIVPVSARPLTLADHASPPLVESVRVMNKVSHNLRAELLLRTVAREKTGYGSTNAGLWLEQDFLKSAGVAEGDVQLSDGSGLGHDNLVTPRATVMLLRYAAAQPWGQQFISTFPIAGTDGTLEGRMKKTPAAGLIHAKTGSLENVRAISGYATTIRGEELIFAMFANNNPQKGTDTAATLDAIAIAMVETLGIPTKKKK